MKFFQLFAKLRSKKNPATPRSSTPVLASSISPPSLAGPTNNGPPLQQNPSVGHEVNTSTEEQDHSLSHAPFGPTPENSDTISADDVCHSKNSEPTGLWRRILRVLLRGWDMIVNITTCFRPSRPLHTVPNLSECLTDRSEYTVAESNMSDIYIAKLNGTTKVAIKQIRGVGASRKTIKRRINREKTVWATFEHPNIVPFVGYVEFWGKWGALISPWYRRGNAKKCIGSFGPSKRFDLWCEIIEGVLYLHSRRPTVIHGDLKLTNVLIDDDGHALICDFGLARILSEKKTNLTTTTNYTGSLRYIAYELANSNKPLIVPTPASDIYAVGCLGLEIMFLQEPHESRRTNPSIYTAIGCNAPPAESLPSGHTPSEPIRELWNLLKKCWEVNPADRPTAVGLRKWVIDHKGEVSDALEIYFSGHLTSPVSPV